MKNIKQRIRKQRLELVGVELSTKLKLDKIKLVESETYDSVIKRLLKNAKTK